ncbi:MAG: TraR/DksA family transcriptional regulator [Betaproteobacteria bacterium]|nr:TraR/DksA family transcriptional regulator [Betaproteobacteria bacterium]
MPSHKLVQALAQRERDLREKIAERRGALEDASHPADPAGDLADKAFERTRAEVEHDLIEMSLKELADIAALRERLANGTYGECVECREPIPAARLEVNPTARRCADCQARHEKMTGAL